MVGSRLSLATAGLLVLLLPASCARGERESHNQGETPPPSQNASQAHPTASGERAGTADESEDSRDAKAYLDQRDFTRAQQVLERLVDSGLASPSEYAQLSELYLAGGTRDKGEQVLRAGLTRHPRNPFLTFRLGSYLAALTKYQDAVPYLIEAESLAPTDPVVIRLLSIAQARLGDRAASAAAAGRLYALAPGRDEGLLYATQLEAAGDVAAAERVYREVLVKTPDDAIVLNNLATLLTGRGQLQEAEQLARQAVQKEPRNGRILDTLGSVQYRSGRMDEAVETFRRAIELAPDVANLHYHYSLALAAHGQAPAAKQALAEARRLDPRANWPDLATTTPPARDRR